MSNHKAWLVGVLTLVPLATAHSNTNAAISPTDANKALPDRGGLQNFEQNELDLILRPAGIISRAEINSPEFSTPITALRPLNRELYLPTPPEEPLIARSNHNFNTHNWNYHQLRPRSGAQLYQQRQAALKAGRLYTRLEPSSFQSAWLNASSQPTHQDWQKLLAQEARVMAQSQGSNRLNIIVGDSLTLWLPTQGLAANKFWLNQGISGENTSHILSRLKAFAQTRPDRIYLMAGINDLRNGKSDYEILTNMRKMMQELRQTHPQAEVIVQSILPTRLSNISNDRIQQLNYHIQNIAQQEGSHYLNLANIFTDSTGQLNADYTTDGLHLSPEGYQAWQIALQQTEEWLNQ